MNELQLATSSDDPEVLIEHISGDLTVRGWRKNDIVARADDDAELFLYHHESKVIIRCSDDCQVHLPLNALLHIDKVDDDAKITDIQGSLTIDVITGDLSLHNVGPTKIDIIDDDLSAKRINGDCKIERISGDASIRDVRGDCHLDNVGDDLSLADVQGNLFANVHSDASLALTLTPGQHVEVSAGDDLACRIPANTGATIKVRSGDDIAIKGLPISSPITHGEHEFVIGSGEATLILSAGDDLALTGRGGDGQREFTAEFDFDFGPELGARAAEFAEKITEQVEAQVENMTRQLDEKLGKLGQGGEWARVQEKAQAAMRRAEERLSETMRHTEQRIHEAERRTARMHERQPRRARRAGRNHAHDHQWQTVQPPEPPKPPSAPAPATDAERMMILRMVEEGKISVEQAEQLLTAINTK